MFETLKRLLGCEETIYEIERCAAAPVYVIGPVVEDINRQLDVSGCIEDTLHLSLIHICSLLQKEWNAPQKQLKNTGSSKSLFQSFRTLPMKAHPGQHS